MSPNGFRAYSRLPAWNRGISLRARGRVDLMSGADNVRSTPAAGERKVHPFSFRARGRFVFPHGVRTEQVSGAPVGGCGLVVCHVSLKNQRFSCTRQTDLESFCLRGIIIHKMAASPTQAGNTTICAIRFKERCAITSGRGCRARRRGRDSARGSLWRGTSAGVCGG